MRRRHTLIELAVVVSLVLIIAAVGWVSTRHQVPRYRLRKAAGLLQGDLNQARASAISMNRETRLLFEPHSTCKEGSSWGGKWKLQVGDKSSGSTKWDTLPLDLEEDGSDDDQSRGSFDIGPDGNRETPGVCLRRAGATAGSGFIVFNTRGWPANDEGDFVETGNLRATLVSMTALGRGDTAEVDVVVSRSGEVKLETFFSQ